MVQKEEGIRERLMSYSLVIQRNVTSGFWKPYFVTQCPHLLKVGQEVGGERKLGMLLMILA